MGFLSLVDNPQLLLLGAIAGFTIFLGLPLAALRNVTSRKKGLLNAVAIGILIFLIVDVFAHAWGSAQDAVTSSIQQGSPPEYAVLTLFAMFGGTAIGLLGLTWYGRRYMRQASPRPVLAASAASGSTGNGQQKLEIQLVHQVDAYRLSMMIAIGIGAHNFSEGLAIGQSFASGAVGLATMLIIGFAAHNATEGFGIAGPLTGLSNKPSLRFLFLAGLIGGGPTFLGTLLGSLGASPLAYILFLAIAGGALVYVSMLMYTVARGQVTDDVLMLGLFVGISVGLLTDLLVTLGGI